MIIRVLQITILFCAASHSLSHAQMMGQQGQQGHQHDTEKGKALYQKNCIACHGENGQGNADLKAPMIAGQHEWYLRAQIGKFKNGMRGAHPEDVEGKLMVPSSQLLATDQEIHDVSAYLASLKPAAPRASIEGNANRGKFLFANCAACHGNLGQGMQQVNAPSLIRIDDWYIKSQLSKFKRKIRGGEGDNLQGKQMQAMVALMQSEQDMNDIIAYINNVARQVNLQ